MVEDDDDLAGFFDPDEFGVAAIYRAGGAGGGVPVVLLPSRPDRAVALFGSTGLVATSVFLARVSEIPAPAAGDTLEIGGVLHAITGDPVRDDGRGLWTIEAPEQ